MKVKCVAQEHNTMTGSGLERGPLDPESSTLTTRPLHLPRQKQQHNLALYVIILHKYNNYLLSVYD